MASAPAIADLAGDARALLLRGLEESHRGEYKALHTLTAALDRLRGASDERGAMLAAAALVVTGQCMTNYRRFREHADALARLRDGSIEFATPDEELWARAGLLCGLLFLNPSDPAIDACVDRIMTLLEHDLDVNTRYAAGRLVLYYTEPRENRELGQRVYALLQPLSEHPELTPHRLGRWLILWIRCSANAKETAQHARACERARQLLERHREPEVAAWLAMEEFEPALRSRDFARIERVLASMEAVADPTNLFDLARLAWVKGRYALAKGEGDAALFHAGRSRRYAEEFEVPPPMMGVRLALEAQAKVLVGDYAGARETFRRTAEIVAVLHAEEMRDMIRMVDAYEALKLRRPDARQLLADAFAAPRSRQFYDSFDTNPPFGATMCALALEHDVEPEFVRRVIELHALAPPREAGSSWPWPTRVHTLGAFELSRAGTTVALQGKIQKKPLELLKALIASGGHHVDKTRLADFLWPDAESDAAAAALDMAISRLRKMLGQPSMIRIEDGKVGLDPEQVWVDVWAFDRDVEALQAALRAPGDANDDEVAMLGQRLLSRYRGAFLENEEPQRWLLAARERWRSRFLRSLADAGRHWERRQRWFQAIELYERGIEVDTLAEDLYRKLMQCHLAQGQPAEAARVYRRCRDMLSVQLGIAPSSETEALFRTIYRPK